MSSWYLELKALHIISVVAWFAGLFYIFRLFVYHHQNSANGPSCQMLSTMERRLLYAIIFPANAMTLLSGTALVSASTGFLAQNWFWAKISLVVFLLLYQLLAWRTFCRFRRGDFYLSEKACRVINEIPTVLLIGIVFLVVLKPWN